jgi:hypothetical protein
MHKNPPLKIVSSTTKNITTSSKDAIKRSKAYTIATDSSADIVVAGVQEVEVDAIYGKLSLSVLIAELVLPFTGGHD